MIESEAVQDPDLPWLQEVEDEDAPRGISARTMLVGIVLVLLIAAAVAATFFWLGRREAGAAGAPELIQAPAKPYKIKPKDPGGLDIAGQSQTSFDTSAGKDVDSQLNLGIGEHVAAPAAGSEEDSGQTDDGVAEKVVAKPEPKPQPSGAPGTVIQLGAYSNKAQAERAWTVLSTRFDVLSSLTKVVVPYSAGGSSGYRLRAAAASADAASAACKTIQAGGESCFVAR
ncbi:MAG TPA: SPOR domain-containing protein [Sphingomicrobium sp.]|nr:SPOR domain-containing protein [Sphingomicrobium sp.]